MRIDDLIGKRIGSFVILEKIETSDKKHSYYKCKCDCGNIFKKRQDIIKNAKHKACNLCKRKRPDMITHNHSNTKLYRVYYSMKERCYSNNSNEYHNYGCRGIKVCSEWLNNFEVFYKWAMDNGYQNGLQIDRVDNNGDYEPSNCRWVTPEENSNNKRTCVYITYKDKTLTINQWARLLGINKNTFWRYIRKKNYTIDYIINNYCEKEVVW